MWVTPAAELAPPGNRLHLDIAVQDDDDVHRLIALGAEVVRREEGWTVLVDPEGQEFCAVPARV